MLKINFDLFYELNHGSVISNSHQNVKKYWRLVDGNIEVKLFVNQKLRCDWHTTDGFHFPIDGVFKIEERFEK